MTLSKNTIRQYLSKINRLNMLLIPFDASISTDDIVDRLSKKNLSISTIKGYLTAIIWKLKADNFINPIFLSSLSAKINSFSSIIQADIDKNLLSLTQQKSFISWNDILLVHSRLKSFHSPRSHVNFVLLSLYVLFPPRRIHDYSHMFLVFDKINIIDNSKNYLVLSSTPLFIFNDYKTKLTYGSQEFIITPDLALILHAFVDNLHILNGNSLLHMSDLRLIRRLNSIFLKFTNKKVSANIIRHSFITHCFDSLILRSKLSRIDIASKMAHSILMQIDYYKIINSTL